MEHNDLIHDVKVSHENSIDHIFLKFMNEQLCLKYFSLHPLMIDGNNINKINFEPIIMKIFFADLHDRLPNSKIFYVNATLLQCFIFNNSMLL